MMNLEDKKEKEINNMVTILKQIDLPDILLLSRDAKERGYSDYDVENQRLRYIAIWVVIEEAGLEEEFGHWKMQK